MFSDNDLQYLKSQKLFQVHFEAKNINFISFLIRFQAYLLSRIKYHIKKTKALINHCGVGAFDDCSEDLIINEMTTSGFNRHSLSNCLNLLSQKKWFGNIYLTPSCIEDGHDKETLCYDLINNDHFYRYSYIKAFLSGIISLFQKRKGVLLYKGKLYGKNFKSHTFTPQCLFLTSNLPLTMVDLKWWHEHYMEQYVIKLAINKKGEVKIERIPNQQFFFHEGFTSKTILNYDKILNTNKPKL